jgi:O-antigen ligase
VLAEVPTLSTPMIYPPQGLIMAEAFAPGLAVLAILLAATTRRSWGRALASQLVLPAALTLAGVVLVGALPLVTGLPVCPIVPRYTAWMSPVLLMMATGAGVAGLVVLASAALPPSDPSAPRGTRRRPPAAP